MLKYIESSRDLNNLAYLVTETMAWEMVICQFTNSPVSPNADIQQFSPVEAAILVILIFNLRILTVKNVNVNIGSTAHQLGDLGQSLSPIEFSISPL